MFNKQQANSPDPPLHRSMFERDFITYSLVQFQLFMGSNQAFLPFNIYSDFDRFIGDNIDNFYAQFVMFWGEHSLFKPCAPIRGHEKETCGKCLIVDGHMKIRRRICSNPAMSLTLPAHFDHVFDDILIGCSHSPAVNSRLCPSCKEAGVVHTVSKKRPTMKEKENARRREKGNDDAHDPTINTLMDVSIRLVQ